MVLSTADICASAWKARDFALKGVDGKTYSLLDVRGPNGTLIVFICNHCPYVKASIDRTPMAVWHEGNSGELMDIAVDMTLRLDNAAALPTAATANRSLISSGGRNGREIQLTNWSPWPYGRGPLQSERSAGVNVLQFP